MDVTVIVVVVVLTALIFDFTNGFHDTANAMADLDRHRRTAPQGRRGARRVPEPGRRLPVRSGSRRRSRVWRPARRRQIGSSRGYASKLPATVATHRRATVNAIPSS